MAIMPTGQGGGHHYGTVRSIRPSRTHQACSNFADRERDAELIKDNPTEATEAAIEKFVDEHPSPRIDRFLDFLDAMESRHAEGNECGGRT